MTSSVAATPVSSASAEPVFVFGSNQLGQHTEGHAAVAARFHQAKDGEWSGRTGNAYAIPYRDRDYRLLSVKAIDASVKTFMNHAAANRSTQFQVARFACEKGAFSDSEIANLFQAPSSNCALSGVWQRVLDPRRPVRIMIYDPAGRLLDSDWQDLLGRYLNINLPLWGAHGVELISTGGARNIVAADAAARRLGLRQRVVGDNPSYYGAQAGIAAEMKAVWCSTHLLSITDPDQTSQPARVRVLSFATRDGLDCDDLYPGMFD